MCEGATVHGVVGDAGPGKAQVHQQNDGDTHAYRMRNIGLPRDSSGNVICSNPTHGALICLKFEHFLLVMQTYVHISNIIEILKL